MLKAQKNCLEKLNSIILIKYRQNYTTTYKTPSFSKKSTKEIKEYLLNGKRIQEILKN